MIGRNILALVREAVVETAIGNIEAPQLSDILDAMSAQVRDLRRLPGQDNEELRSLGARLDGWLASISQPGAALAPGLLEMRLRQIERDAHAVFDIEDERAPSIPPLPGNVISFAAAKHAQHAQGMRA